MCFFLVASPSRSFSKRALRKAELKVVCDPMYGTARGYLDLILRSIGCEVTVIHDELDPDFDRLQTPDKK